ncbi:MAG: lipopolysaccharide heptosyltransferase II [Candidatus Ancaeobacter aquaticus]|nr:lipopolysaccharide heptosyltransferase II [Candidatus Ancaeobacter aquaticus]
MENQYLIIDYIVYVLCRTAVSVLNCIPRGCINKVSVVIGTILYYVDLPHKRTMHNNLLRAFGDSKTEAERKEIAHAVFCNLIKNTLNYLRIKKYDLHELKGMVTENNRHYVEESLARKKGLILVAAHFGNWEMMGVLGSLVLKDYTVVTVGRRQNNKYLDAFVTSLREYTHNKIVPKSDAVFSVMRTLKHNGIVCLYADQSGGNDSIPVEFFGKMVQTVSSPAEIAYKTGASIVPIFLVASGDTYSLTYEKPIVPELSKDRIGEVKRVTASYARAIEQYVRSYPREWFWVHKRWKSKKAKKKIADSYKILIHMPNWIGDMVMSLPAIHAVRKLFPNAKITACCYPHIAPLLTTNSDIDSVYVLPPRKKGFTGLTDMFKTGEAIRRGRYDLGLLFPNSVRSAVLFFLGRVSYRVGYAKDGRGFLLSQCVKRDKDTLRLHHSAYYYRIAKEIGNVPDLLPPSITIDSESKQWAKDEVLSKRSRKGPLIGVNPGAAFGPAKRWPLRKFRELIIELIKNTDADIVLFGSPKEADRTKEITSNLPYTIINMAGKTNLLQLAAGMQVCDTVVSNDSGPMHIASAVGVSVVALFGSTDPNITAPLGSCELIYKDIECSPCLKRTCLKNYECMESITVEDVYRSVEKLLLKKGTVPFFNSV